MRSKVVFVCLVIMCQGFQFGSASLSDWLIRGRRQIDNVTFNTLDVEGVDAEFPLSTTEKVEANETSSSVTESPVVIDLHNDEFCVDVSTYGEVSFEPVTRKKCDTVFVKNCKDKDEQICDDVTEIQCDIVPFTECSMSMNITPFKSYETVSKTFSKKICKEGMDTVQHTKMMPECRNITKQNCITNWKTDAKGNQVWAGNESCEPVTWRECQLVPRQVDFKVPKIICEEGEPIPYTDLQEAEKEQMTSTMSCEVKHSTNCVPVKQTKCKTLVYQECEEEPVENCSEQEIMIPVQEKEHKKKCLLPDDGTGFPSNPRNLGDDSIEFPTKDSNRIDVLSQGENREETTTSTTLLSITFPTRTATTAEPIVAEESRIRISEGVAPPQSLYRRLRQIAPVRGHVLVDPKYHNYNWQD
ncbi:uncharacterized protein [Lepeophtheirus salmonis]|uniref:uncharacterized protein n=1 Tax=Lepeophtheirus salmonis TaxID=72036 RepID=UPI001AE64C0E|nr:uncharacterized protein LOC121132299 [Lepeophtheirus salmonis]